MLFEIFVEITNQISTILAKSHNMKIWFDNDECPKTQNFYRMERCMSKNNINVYINVCIYMLLRRQTDLNENFNKLKDLFRYSK